MDNIIKTEEQLQLINDVPNGSQNRLAVSLDYFEYNRRNLILAALLNKLSIDGELYIEGYDFQEFSRCGFMGIADTLAVNGIISRLKSMDSLTNLTSFLKSDYQITYTDILENKFGLYKVRVKRYGQDD